MYLFDVTSNCQDFGQSDWGLLNLWVSHSTTKNQQVASRALTSGWSKSVWFHGKTAYSYVARLYHWSISSDKGPTVCLKLIGRNIPPIQNILLRYSLNGTRVSLDSIEFFSSILNFINPWCFITICTKTFQGPTIAKAAYYLQEPVNNLREGILWKDKNHSKFENCVHVLGLTKSLYERSWKSGTSGYPAGSLV